MPITLVTGTPGAGKTLFAVKMLIEEILPTGRPVFTNINGFSAPQFSNLTIVGPEGPKEWETYPDGAFCVFDEIQHQYPFKNGMSQTPAYIRGYETHRHSGKDFVFITQGPGLLDRHLHPLIERHFHVHRPFGFKRSTVREWQGVNAKPEPLQSETNAVRRNFNFPKKYFDHYKSSTVHTVKARIPWKLFGYLLGIVGLVVFAIYMGWQFSGTRMLNMGDEESAELMQQATGSSGASDDGGTCAYIQAVTQVSVVTRINGKRYVLRREGVSIDGDQLRLAGEIPLAFPLCRVTR